MGRKFDAIINGGGVGAFNGCPGVFNGVWENNMGYLMPDVKTNAQEGFTPIANAGIAGKEDLDNWDRWLFFKSKRGQ